MESAGCRREEKQGDAQGEAETTWQEGLRGSWEHHGEDPTTPGASGGTTAWNPAPPAVLSSLPGSSAVGPGAL